MNHNRLTFEILPRRINEDNTDSRQFRKELLQTQDQTLRSLVGIASNLTVSLRYYYDPKSDPNCPELKTYLLIHPLADSQTEEIIEQVNVLLTKGKFSKFFALNRENNFSQFQPLTWVEFIGEVIKNQQFIEPHYYLPHFIESNLDNDMLDVWEVISGLDNRLILEITLQKYHNPSEKSSEKLLWVNAIQEMLVQLDKLTGTKDHLLSTTIALYQKYQQLYAVGDLFQYSIKVLAENRGEASVVLRTLSEHATKETAHSKPCEIIIAKGQPGFAESLQATEKVEIANSIQWSGWQNFGQKLIREAIQPKKTGLAKFGDGSLSLTAKPSLPISGNSAPNQNPPGGSDIVVRGSSALAKFSAPPPARFLDLKPLSKLVTAQEISGFFRVAVPKVNPAISVQETTQQISEEFTQGFSIDYLIQKHRALITEDSYIAGIDQYGNVCISDFSKIPHRIVAGVTGSGKTNFITSVIYQFLLANPERKIYIADFQNGLHYQFIVDQQPSVKMVTQLEECKNLLADLWSEHEERRQQMLKNKVRNLEDLNKIEGIDKKRTLLIIDEAFYIKTAERGLRGSIETNLNNLAAQSRVTGIHIIYCSQRPTSEVIDPQTANNMDERVIFRVSSVASQLLLGDYAAASLPIEPKGRAVYRGIESELKFLATPYVPDEIWDQKLP